MRETRKAVIEALLIAFLFIGSALKYYGALEIGWWGLIAPLVAYQVVSFVLAVLVAMVFGE